jgi:hypothetical protein
MITDVKSPAEPLRPATREQKSPVGIEQSNKGSSRQQLISQSVVQSSITGTEKVSLLITENTWQFQEVLKQEQCLESSSTVEPLDTVSFKILPFSIYTLLPEFVQLFRIYL